MTRDESREKTGGFVSLSVMEENTIGRIPAYAGMTEKG
jgi:hypothetical protein